MPMNNLYISRINEKNCGHEYILSHSHINPTEDYKYNGNILTFVCSLSRLIQKKILLCFMG